MTFTFDLETGLKISADSLRKDILWVKYEPDWVKAREDMLRTRDIDGLKVGKTDGRVD